MKSHARRAIPYNTKTWTQIGTITGQLVSAFVKNLGILYAGVRKNGAGSNGLFALNYPAKTWAEVGTLPGTYVTALCSMSDVIYASVNNAATHTVFKLTLPGTWTGMGRPDTIYGGSLVTLGGKLYATFQNSAVDKVWEYNSGTTWIDRGCPGGTTDTSLVVHAGELYAWYSAAGDVVVKKWAGGTTWDAAGSFTPAAAAGFYAGCSDGTSIYLAGQWGFGLYKCTPPSTTWVSDGDATTYAQSLIPHEGRIYLAGGCVTPLGGCVGRRDDANLWANIGTITAGSDTYCVFSFNGHLYYGEGLYGTDNRSKVYELGMRHQGS